jgi:hypothetical protein
VEKTKIPIQLSRVTKVMPLNFDNGEIKFELVHLLDYEISQEDHYAGVRPAQSKIVRFEVKGEFWKRGIKTDRVARGTMSTQEFSALRESLNVFIEFISETRRGTQYLTDALTGAVRGFSLGYRLKDVENGSCIGIYEDEEHGRCEFAAKEISLLYTFAQGAGGFSA